MNQFFCLYYKNNQVQFGWIKELVKNRLLVLPLLGREFVCSQNQAILKWPSPQFKGEKEALSFLSEQSRLILNKAEKIDTQTIYELCEPSKNYFIDELADCFLEDSQNGEDKAALFLALQNNSLLFQQNKDQFKPRNEKEMEDLLILQTKKDEQELHQLIEKQWAESLINNCLPEIEEGHQIVWERFVYRLKQFLIFFHQSQEKEYFRYLFSLDLNNQIMAERQLLRYLELAGERFSWGQMILSRTRINFDFSQEELTQADRINQGDPMDTVFNLETADITDKRVFTVDSNSTRDFDDAITLEKEDGYTKLFIFIADVASYVLKGDPLFKKAEERVMTLYTLKGSYPMLPRGLSEGRFSLIEKKQRPVMTFEVVLSENNEILETKIYRSLIQVERNLNFDEVDRMISSKQGFWPELYQICLKQKSKRLEEGALDLKRIEAKLDISDEESIQLKTLYEDLPSMMLVQELAILANSIAATYMKTHQVNTLFRNQAPYTLVSNPDEGERPSIENVQIQSAKLNLESMGHAALGVESYLQATSPIRRFLDLAAQGAIFQHLSEGKNLFLSEELLSWVAHVDETTKIYAKTERLLSDHWKIKYLFQNVGKMFKAQLVRYLKGNLALVCLVELQFIAEMTLPEIDVGTYFQVKIDGVDPLLDQVRLIKYNPALKVTPSLGNSQ
ncbi:MAG: RNB domain-containing ribonuclease [Deltaproteobacteria bacterium]|nr:RNB domain-containing ribonuclease [Deltaproteobacteria bacterium]